MTLFPDKTMFHVQCFWYSFQYSFYWWLFLVYQGSWGFHKMYVIHREKAMATQSSALAWNIPWTEEPGRLQSMGWLRVRYDWATSLSLFTFMHWRRKWQPTPVFLPGESQGGEPGGLPSTGSQSWTRLKWLSSSMLYIY